MCNIVSKWGREKQNGKADAGCMDRGLCHCVAQMIDSNNKQYFYEWNFYSKSVSKDL